MKTINRQLRRPVFFFCLAAAISSWLPVTLHLRAGTIGTDSLAAPPSGSHSKVHKPDSGVVRVAHLVYGPDGANHTTRCFSTGYLDLLKRETGINTDDVPVQVPLESPDLYNFPFAVMSGEDSFTLTDEQVSAMRAYLDRGGFILASAGCSNAPWAKSFLEQIRRVFPDQSLTELPLDHPIFQSVFQIDDLRTKTMSDDVHLFGLTVNQRLVMVYSPEGLNDTGNSGTGCCCCGGNEIRNAKYINANVLAWVLRN